MVPEDHALRQFFHEVVNDCYQEYLQLEDSEITSYVADLLTDFCSSDRLYPIRDPQGRRLKDVGEMLLASDPVNGTAASFDVERRIRKHIGDYALFCTGMYPEAVHKWRENENANLYEMIRTGKESYYIVSQFDQFEYAEEAPLFGRLSECFESCMYGLNQVREEMEKRRPGLQKKSQKFLM
jgi:hypothetical protein